MGNVPCREGGSHLADETSQWLQDLLGQVEREQARPLPPVLRELGDLVEQDAEMYMLFSEMLHAGPLRSDDDAPATGPDPGPAAGAAEPCLDPPAGVQGERARRLSHPHDPRLRDGTPAAFAAFLEPRVHTQRKKILNEWAAFLRSPRSTSTLDDSEWGWFAPHAWRKLGSFVEEFVCDPAAPHYGFRSCDDFFTRRFREGARPVTAPGDQPSSSTRASRRRTG